MNKYHKILDKILNKGKVQENKKGGIRYLTNEVLELKPIDLLEIFEGHGIARNKLKNELELYIRIIVFLKFRFIELQERHFSVHHLNKSEPHYSSTGINA